MNRKRATSPPNMELNSKSAEERKCAHGKEAKCVDCEKSPRTGSGEISIIGHGVAVGCLLGFVHH